MPFVIIIPSYNPDEKLVELVKKLQSLTTFPVVIINDGSDSTCHDLFSKLKNEFKCFVLNHEVNQGKGAALKTGIAFAIKQFSNLTGVVTADGDGQHLPEDILKVGEALKDNPNSLILGTRNLKEPHVPFNSKWGNRITTFIFKLTTGRTVKDTQTGLRGIPASLLSNCLSISGDHYEYEMSMLSDFAKDNIPFTFIPIQTVYINSNKGSHFSPFKDSYRIYKPLLVSLFKMITASVLSALIDLTLFTLFTNLIFGTTALGLLFSIVFARIISGSFNFIINKIWTFDHKGETGKKALQYLALFLIVMFLSWLFVFLLSFLPFHLTGIKAVVDLTLFFISYFIQKTIIFIPSKAKKRCDGIITIEMNTK